MSNHDNHIDEPTVFIIDDERNLRLSLLNLFESMEIRAAVFDSATDFLASSSLTLPGCILLDIQMPGMTGLELQSSLTAIGNPLPIIFMTGNASVPISVTAMKAGAFDFLLKPFNSQTVVSITNSAFQKDAERRAKMVQVEEARACADQLTPRETEVLMYVSQGLLNKQIAFEMSISEIMVKLHRGRMMKKMKARSVVEVVRKFDQVNNSGEIVAA
jgi:FixJ family two-component response regulator